MNNNRPNFFIVGAMKSGTSTLHSILGEHPDIFMCQPKEPCRFVEPEILKKVWPAMYKEGYCTDEEKYLSLFNKANKEKIIGESSTDYSKSPKIENVVDKIYAFNSQAKILYIMRNPVKRAISHYWHAVKREGELRNLEQAIREDSIYIDVSDYAKQITPYIEYFGKDQIKLLTLEEFNTNPKETIQNIFKWLQVDSQFIPSNLGSKEHETAPVVYQMRNYGLLNNIDLSGFKNIVKIFLPQNIRTMGKNIYQKKLIREVSVNQEAILFLQQTLRPKVKDLSLLLDREFPEWDLNYEKHT